MRVETNEKVGLIQTYRLIQFISLYGSCPNRVFHIGLFLQYAL